MIEKEIESKIIQKFSDLFTQNSIDNINIIGVWQQFDTNPMEEKEYDGYLTVKVHPRSYDTPTTPQASFEVDLTVVVKADFNPNGSKFLDVCGIVQDVLQQWQKSYCDYRGDFEVVDEFHAAGVVINGGDVGCERPGKIWTFTQSFTLYGSILN